MKIGLIIITLLIGIVFGIFISAFGEQQLMGDYDLYNCIYNNADRNGFNQHPVMIQKIQEECVCFRENNYTNLFDNC